MNRDSDVIVVGGGVAGSVAAIVAARGGRRVLLVDDVSRRRGQRGETLAPEAKPVLVGLGLWDAFCGVGFTPCWMNRSAWGRRQVRTWDHVFGPYGPAWHVRRHAFETLLHHAAIDAGVRVEEGRVRDVAATPWPEGQVSMAVEAPDGTDHHLSASFVVDSTGRQSTVARRLGGRRRQHDRLIGLLVRYQVGDPGVEAATLVEAAPDGWWFSIGDAAQLVVMFMTDVDLLPPGALSENCVWEALLRQAPETWSRVRSSGAALSMPAVVPAATSELVPFASPGWVAAGDAAVTFDPLASYGILHALISGRDAGEAAIPAAGGDPSILDDYTVQVKERFDGHLAQRRAYYRIEPRWPERAFWKRRRCGTEAGSTRLAHA
jgi:flavin-dependent dehydrogenase